jgi:hypothetical protein
MRSIRRIRHRSQSKGARRHSQSKARRSPGATLNLKSLPCHGCFAFRPFCIVVTECACSHRVCMRSQSVHAVPKCARGPRVCTRPQSVHAVPECACGHRVCMWSIRRIRRRSQSKGPGPSVQHTQHTCAVGRTITRTSTTQHAHANLFKPAALHNLQPIAPSESPTFAAFQPSALESLSTQSVDSLNDPTDSLYRSFYVRSNGKLLEFLSTNYSNHISYHFCTNSGSQTFLCVCNTNGCVCTPTVVSLLYMYSSAHCMRLTKFSTCILI